MSQNIFAALSNKNRLRIALALKKGEMSVNDIAKKLHLPQSEASRALKALKQQGIVRVRNEGRSHLFSLSSEVGGQVMSFVEWHQQSVDKDASKAAQQRDKQIGTLMELNPAPIVCASWPSGKIVLANPEARRLLGAKGPNSLLGKNVWDFFEPSEHKKIGEELLTMQKGRVITDLTKKMVRTDRKVVSARVAVAPYFIYENYVTIFLIHPQ